MESPWKSGDASFRHRIYSSYESYVAHQTSKLAKLDLRDYDTRYRAELSERLGRLDLLRRGSTVLCLGARIGTECKAFIDLGCFAVGVDLNPGPQNAFVVHGDFHSLQFAHESVDYVFTNSLDHAFDLERILTETVRVLKPGGYLIAEIVGGSKDSHGREPGDYESLWWDKAGDVVNVIPQIRLNAREQPKIRLSMEWRTGVVSSSNQQKLRRALRCTPERPNDTRRDQIGIGSAGAQHSMGSPFRPGLQH